MMEITLKLDNNCHMILTNSDVVVTKLSIFQCAILHLLQALDTYLLKPRIIHSASFKMAKIVLNLQIY